MQQPHRRHQPASSRRRRAPHTIGAASAALASRRPRPALEHRSAPSVNRSSANRRPQLRKLGRYNWRLGREENRSPRRAANDAGEAKPVPLGGTSRCGRRESGKPRRADPQSLLTPGVPTPFFFLPAVQDRAANPNLSNFDLFQRFKD
jgi:hypothetical protein